MLAKLNEEIKAAMKSKDQIRLTAIRSIISDAKNVAIANKRKETTDDDIIASINKGLKQREDSYNSYVSANRLDLAEIEQKEMLIFKEFQPKQLSEEDVICLVDAAIATLGVTTKKEMGKVMNEVMKSCPKGSVDGKLVSRLVLTKLQ
jgi:uncharacterized protein